MFKNVICILIIENMRRKEHGLELALFTAYLLLEICTPVWGTSAY